MSHAENPMRIAVLGDLHGHFTLALSLLKRWEIEEKKKLDLILQVGDFGAWPYPFYKLDPATKRFSEKDKDEISFPTYTQDSEETRLFFGYESPDEKRIDAPIIFIKGNHEDFDYLAEKESEHRDDVIPVDFYERFLYLPNGRVTSFKNLTIGGLGGLEMGEEGMRYKKREIKNLSALGGLDILLTHEPHKGALRANVGSEKVRDLIELLSPTYHFCGHLHRNGEKLHTEGETKSFILNEVNFKGRYRLNPGSIGILEWYSKERNDFNFLQAAWLKEYTKTNFKAKAGLPQVEDN